MLERNFQKVYNRFKLSLYSRVFKEFGSKEEEGLSAMEVILMEIILALGEPTVNEFASMSTLSAPNAAYRINQLVKKGYISKIQSDKDKREFHLKVTDKYTEKYGDIFSYINKVSARIRERFPEEDVEKLDVMLGIIAHELMKETNILRIVAERQNVSDTK
ncbi:MAG: MarR family transcriptional regulator [Clostridiales bacterium]|nr:MarR family transcriptional regulator [Clostridiales bacterium]